MKRLVFALVSSILMISAIAQTKTINDPHAQPRDVKGFHAIKVATGIKLYLNQGGEEAVAVSAATTDYRDRIVTRVDNGVLKIYYDNEHWSFHDDNNKNLRAYVSCKVLDALTASSGAHVEVDGSIRTGDLALNFSSGAYFKGNVMATDVTVDQGSGSQSNISGNTGKLSVEASSGSEISAFDLQSEQCEARASSGASIEISVNKMLTASAHSGGHINYKGSGVISNVNTSSGGSVSKR